MTPQKPFLKNHFSRPLLPSCMHKPPKHMCSREGQVCVASVIWMHSLHCAVFAELRHAVDAVTGGC